MDGYLSPRVLRLACRLTSDRSFAIAAERLFECCGITVSDETLRRHCLVVGAEVAGWMRNAPEAAVPFQKATGEVECQVDAGKVNTQGGWRDLKVVAFTKRPLGLAATPAEWTSRRLPPPSARIVLADIEGIDRFRRDWRVWADRLAIGSGLELTVLGDGAEWIWNAAEAQFPGCRQVLDVFHALDYVSSATKHLYGEGTEQAKTSYATAQLALLSEGWAGICRWIGMELEQSDTPDRRAAVQNLIDYLSKHLERLDYKSRLAEGRSIGSGFIEGTIKTLGLRMKARGAKWVEINAENMAALVGLSNSTLWDTYWTLAV